VIELRIITAEPWVPDPGSVFHLQKSEQFRLDSSLENLIKLVEYHSTSVQGFKTHARYASSWKRNIIFELFTF
jgi:hypothetical protein